MGCSLAYIEKVCACTQIFDVLCELKPMSLRTQRMTAYVNEYQNISIHWRTLGQFVLVLSPLLETRLLLKLSLYKTIRNGTAYMTVRMLSLIISVLPLKNDTTLSIGGATIVFHSPTKPHRKRIEHIATR